MIRDLSVSFRLEGLDAPIDASLVYIRSTYGGFDHYQLGLGHGGALLAVYDVRSFRAGLFVHDPIEQSPDAPAEVTRGAIDLLAPIFHALWCGHRVDALDGNGRHVTAYCMLDGRIVEPDGRAYAPSPERDEHDSLAFVDRGRVLRVPRAKYRAA